MAEQNLIEALRVELQRTGLSAERAGAILGLNPQELRRWLTGRHLPNPIYAEALERGLSKLRKQPDSPMKAALADRDTYRRLCRLMNFGEKEWLLSSADYSTYRQRLGQLNAKYEIKA